MTTMLDLFSSTNPPSIFALAEAWLEEDRDRVVTIKTKAGQVFTAVRFIRQVGRIELGQQQANYLFIYNPRQSHVTRLLTLSAVESIACSDLEGEL